MLFSSSKNWFISTVPGSKNRIISQAVKGKACLMIAIEMRSYINIPSTNIAVALAVCPTRLYALLWNISFNPVREKISPSRIDKTRGLVNIFLGCAKKAWFSAHVLDVGPECCAMNRLSINKINFPVKRSVGISSIMFPCQLFAFFTPL